MAPHPAPKGLRPPAPFRIARRLKPGRYPLLRVFPGLNRVHAFRGYPCAPTARRNLARRSFVEIVNRKGEWMYVAPHEIPPDADKRWKPIVTADDCVVVSNYHLTRSPAVVLYMDILHELYHVVQRQAGRELWDDDYDYVDRPTEVEAYRFAVEEARRLNAPDSFLREYLRVEWVSERHHRRLLKNLGVSLKDPTPTRPRA
ncbi:MAG: hypothetical protein L3K15_04670 [Thermoplasmata archaeon]|nr:hypothetical protein [Thermoplasmata archaeon]